MDRYKVRIEPRVFHFKQPAGTSRGVYTTRQSWLVHVTDTVTQATGVGECAPLPDLSCDFTTTHEYESELCEACSLFGKIGEDAFATLGDKPSMLFGLETALHGCRGTDTPADRTPFALGQEGITINGLVWMGDYDTMLHRMEEKLAAGFHCIKLKIGAIDFDDELSLLRLIRERYKADEVELRVDANGAFSPDDAMRRLEQLACYDLHSIEQPIRAGQYEAMARICRESPVPVAFDEELIGVNSSDDKRRLLDSLAPQYIVLKPSLHGGACGCAEWVEMASARGIGSWITSALESNVGLCAIAKLAAWLYTDCAPIPQGLGTGQLFTDNIPYPMEIRGDKLWMVK